MNVYEWGNRECHARKEHDNDTNSSSHGSYVEANTCTLWNELCKRVAAAEIEEIRGQLGEEDLIQANEQLVEDIQRYNEILDDIRGRIEDYESRVRKQQQQETKDRRHKQVKLLQQQIAYFVNVLEKRGVDPEKDVRAPPAQTELLQKAKQTQQEGEEVSRRSTSIRSGEDSNKQKQRAFSATTSIPSGKGSSKFRRKLYEDLACSTDTGNEINDLPGSSARRPSTSSSRPLTGSSVDLSVSSAPNVLDQCEEYLNVFTIDKVVSELKRALRSEYEQLQEELHHLEQAVFEETMSGANMGAFSGNTGNASATESGEHDQSFREMKALKAQLQHQYLQTEGQEEESGRGLQAKGHSNVSWEQQRHLQEIMNYGKDEHQTSSKAVTTRKSAMGETKRGGRPGTAAGIDKELELFFEDH